MNLKIHCLGIPESAERNAWIEGELEELGRIEKIEAATVALVCYRGANPAFAATVLLVTAGLDLHQEAIGCTLDDAAREAMNGLRRRIYERERNRAWQVLSSRQRAEGLGRAVVGAC